ncbi:hypothetical protein LguiA_010201 [Lonicera macranthoides]
MGRNQLFAKFIYSTHLILLLIGLISCIVAYAFLSFFFRDSTTSLAHKGVVNTEGDDDGDRGCCRGIAHLELWGDAVKWGSEFKVKSSGECCRACKEMCKGVDGPCLCDSWVFCGDTEGCGSKFGETNKDRIALPPGVRLLHALGCDKPPQLNSATPSLQVLTLWPPTKVIMRALHQSSTIHHSPVLPVPLCWLKKQKDALDPDRRDSGDNVIWTSGIIFGKGEGIIGLETDYGILHLKLFPDCAPHSVSYILELLALRHCAGCEFHRAESRGNSWDSGGNHIENAPFGPPFALIQGTLEVRGTVFRNIPKEECPKIRRGSVAWVDSGPEFFISLANHNEWKQAYMVFGSVLPEDMEIAERIARLPAKQDLWSNINVSVLESPVPFLFRRIKASFTNLKS